MGTVQICEVDQVHALDRQEMEGVVGGIAWDGPTLVPVFYPSLWLVSDTTSPSYGTTEEEVTPINLP